MRDSVHCVEEKRGCSALGFGFEFGFGMNDTSPHWDKAQMSISRRDFDCFESFDDQTILFHSSNSSLLALK